MTSAGASIDPWPLLRNSASLDQRRALRLVVHGRSGGEIPTCLLTLADELQRIRSAPVQLDVLTLDQELPAPDRSAWLVPLLLWPGAHACSDVPAIRDRLRAGGATVTMLPFLGAWPQWWNAVLAALESQLTAETVHGASPPAGWGGGSFLVLLASRLDPLLIPVRPLG